ncbi:haloacid dehalogenase-like hydrolase, putative [Angomonas deanei]|nr:haloacid dehalogenase-like hydrolase, putative [Angomonas deanei]
MAGILTFLDPPRPDTKETIRRSKQYGVDVKMITGDHLLIAKEMCRMLNLDPNILTADKLPKIKDANDLPDDLGQKYGDMMLSVGGFAQVFPEHKFMIVETLRQRGFTCAMTGDGVNDAPALKRADVGIAVHGATDAARAAADMVLTEPGLSVVVEAMLVSREVFQRMLSFLTYRISATLQLVVFFFIACFSLTPRDYGSDDPDFQFFHLPVIMFMLITLLNDGCLMTIGYDHVIPSERPQKWNLPVVFVSASILSAVACGSSLMMLWIGLEGFSEEYFPRSWFNIMGLAQLPQGKLVTLMYLKISISDFLTLFSSRTGGDFFYAMAPSPVLFCGAIVSLLVSTMAAAFWHKTRPDGVLTEGLAWGETNAEKLLPLWVWLYCVVWWLAQDIIKVVSHVFMDAVDLFGCVSDTAGAGPITPYDDGADDEAAQKKAAPAPKPVVQQDDKDDNDESVEMSPASPVEVQTPSHHEPIDDNREL